MNPCVTSSRQLSTMKSFNAREVAPSRTTLTRKSKAVVFATSDTTGPLLRKPELKRPERKTEEAEPRKLFPDEAASASTSASISLPDFTSGAPSGVTVEFQRQRAKEMTKYFDSLKFEETAVNSKVFGWTPENEIGNGRWVMMGIAIGLLTEYATGVDFPAQLKLMVQYLGIADLE